MAVPLYHFVDAHDLPAQARFWSQVLDLRVLFEAEVERIIALGARRADVGQGEDVSWVVLADPEGNEFCVLRPKKSPVG
jgi:hypothetical protein